MSLGEGIIVGVDVGTSLTRTIIAQRQKGSLKPLILGVGTAPSCGVSKGVVVDIEEVVNSITQSKEEAERSAGIPVEHAFVSINGSHMFSQFSKGVVAVSRADGEIGEEDINRVINAAQAISLSNNREIVNVIAGNYTVDGQENIKNPVGMTGVRLEVDSLVVGGASPFIRNLTKCVEKCGIDVDDLVFASIAASKAVLSKRQMELGVVEVDIGKEITGVSVFEDGNILHSSVLPIGAGHITNDIAIGLRTSVDTAEKIKLEYGTALAEEVNKKEKVNISDVNEEEEGVFSRKYIAEIIEARAEEMFKMVDKELKKIDRSGMLPAGIVITGGGAKMPGMVGLAKNVLKLPAQVGFPTGLDGVVDRVDDPSFATVVGLIIWGAEESEAFLSDGSGKFFKLLSLDKIGQKARKIFRTFLP